MKEKENQEPDEPENKGELELLQNLVTQNSTTLPRALWQFPNRTFQGIG